VLLLLLQGELLLLARLLRRDSSGACVGVLISTILAVATVVMVSGTATSSSLTGLYARRRLPGGASSFLVSVLAASSVLRCACLTASARIGHILRAMLC